METPNNVNGRNDLSQIEQNTTIPVRLEEYSCGCWGRHHPPSVIENVVLFEVGVGYKSNNHLHGQNLYVLEVADNMALIEMRKFGDFYGAGLWHYLIGVDAGTPWIAHLPKTINTISEAIMHLMPAEVRRAQLRGLEIKRQGDFFFIPLGHEPKGEIYKDTALDDDHFVQELIRRKTICYARGYVRHGHHATLELGRNWHRVIRNNALRTGYLALGGNQD